MKFLKEKIKNLKNKKLNNNGSAIVFVVVIMALMGTLVLTSLYMAVSNFYMKANDFQTKNNLYSAEGVLDEIKAGIQQQASVATDVAYMQVMQNYTVFNKDEDKRSDEFVYQYITSLRNYYQDTNETPKDQYYDINKLIDSITGKVNLISITTDGAVGAEVSVADGADNLMIAYTDALVFKDVSVKYKDEKGYVTMITTDIRVDVPEISFESAMTIPEIISYSLIANEQLSVESGHYTTVSGSVYGGRQGILADGQVGLHFKESDMVITPNLVTSSDMAKVTVDKDSTLWAGGTLVDKGATLNLLGNAYIEDDTTVDGTASNLYISGNYLGFGDETKKAEKSSAIIINGQASNVNLTNVNRLLLPGNAFIGMSNGGEMITMADGSQLKDEDIGLGESMTAKSSQIAYLVPSECIGYIEDECVLGSNPVLYSKYKSEFVDKVKGLDKTQYKEVDFSKISNDGTDYEKKYSANFKQKFVSINNGTASGDSLVYYYITFTDADEKINQQNAAKFFKDYFEDNEENIRKYLDIYIDTLNVDSDDIFRLNVAGNLLSKVQAVDEDGNLVYEDVEIKDKDGNVTGTEKQPVMKYELINETKSSDVAAGVSYDTELAAYKSVFRSLFSRLSKTGENDDEVNNVIEVDASNAYTGGGIFENLIDKSVFDFVTSSAETGTTKHAEFFNGAEGVKAIVEDNEGGAPYELTNETPLTTSLLIVSGDVIVKRDFAGTIIAGGDIILDHGGAENSSLPQITHDRDMVRHVLDIANTFTSKTNSSDKKNISPMMLFKSGMNISTQATTGSNKSDIIIEELVTYENWTKQ